MSTVYVLKSLKDPKRYYIGITRDLERRLKEHNSEQAGYSKRYAPWEVETCVTFKNEELARRFEKYLKAGLGQAFLRKKLI